MGYLNVPANGWPQLKDLEKLDKIAQQMENMPTFTSDDRAFLEALPAFPTEEGKKVLTATTDDQGVTDLTYKTPEVEGVDIAPTFSESVTYPAGTLVYYEGALYKFTEDHAAGAWDPLEVTETSVATEFVETNAFVDEIKEFLDIVTANLAPNSDVVTINYGMTVSKSGNTKIANVICEVGTITDTVNWTTLCDIPSGFLPASKYELLATAGTTVISVQLNESSNHLLIRPTQTISNAVITFQIIYF